MTFTRPVGAAWMAALARTLLPGLVAIGLTAGAAVANPPSGTDDLGAAIAEAQRAHRADDLAATQAALELASQIIARRQAEMLGRFLPAPPEGWTAGEVETDTTTGSRFGGGLIAKRRYTNGTHDAVLQVMANSPVIAQVGPLFSNPTLLGAIGRVIRVKGKTAVLSRDGKVQILLGRTLVVIQGSASEQEKRALLERLDLDAIAGFAG